MTEISIPEELMPPSFGRKPGEGADSVFLIDIPELQQFVGENVQKPDFNKRLAERLRGNSQITHLRWETGYTSQLMLDCISTMKCLEVLSIGLLRAADLSGLEKLRRLQCLSMDTTGPAIDLSPICKLQCLVTLSLGISKRIKSLDAFRNNSLHALRALLLGSASEEMITVDSLEPISAIQSLEHLVLIQMRPKDRSMAAVTQLPRLKTFQYESKAKFDESHLDILRSRGIDILTF